MLIQIVFFRIEESTKEISFDSKENQITLENGAIESRVNILKKKTFLVCLKRTLLQSVALIRDVRFTALIIRDQYQSNQLLFNVRHVAEELTIEKHYLTHSIRIDRVILEKQNVLHAVLDSLDVRRCSIAIQTTNSSIVVLWRQ